ncbi:MAG TPA: decaprenyl-phosphate phosphoribosyltransferase [Bacteroidia bacterium]|jgi:decaprenyl-phosphate phosphoribosyltransferase|nr:decaprenyl-phosphate phosphoribosyltransferase [Bacteroidia bacterium]
MIKAYLRLIRVHQWTKNLFVFAPLFFSGQFLNSNGLFESCIGFMCFCMAASAVYVFNDIIDVKSDQLHPEKKFRPIASGKITISVAASLSVLLCASSVITACIVSKPFLIVLAIYLAINLAYTLGLKQVSVMDAFIVAIGFVLRVAAGGNLSGIPVSHWLYIMTFLLALFIAFAKRRDDVLIMNETGSQMRKSISGYNLEFISSAISILCAVLIVSYILYITSPEVNARFAGKHPYISTIFVILGVFRYLQITLVENNSGYPSKLVLKDLFLKLIIAGWILFFVIIIYFIK